MFIFFIIIGCLFILLIFAIVYLYTVNFINNDEDEIFKDNDLNEINGQL
jgi:hypothetical protein